MSRFEFHVALLSLITEDFLPLDDLIAAHLHWLKSHEVEGLLVLGTTGEFPNLPLAARKRYLEAVLRHNPGLQVMVNVGAASMADVRELQQHALSLGGVHSLLWMPPFYYPGSGINGLAECLSRLLRAQPADIPLYLYHYPKLSQVPVTAELLSSFPQVAGLKDSSGDFEQMRLRMQPFPNLATYAGTDSELLQAQQAGCIGVISGMANVCPQLFADILRGDTEKQTMLRAMREAMTRFPKIPSLKAVLNSLNLGEQKTVAALPFRDLTPMETDALLHAVRDCSPPISV